MSFAPKIRITELGKEVGKKKYEQLTDKQKEAVDWVAERIIQKFCKNDEQNESELDAEEDIYDTPEGQQFLAEMSKRCRCSQDRPCEGVLMGSVCDDIQYDDGYEDEYDGYEDE